MTADLLFTVSDTFIENSSINQSVSPHPVFCGERASAYKNKCAMWETKQMQQRRGGVAGYMQQGTDIFGHCAEEQITHKSQPGLV